MSGRASPSPARRPQISGQNSSSRSLSKASPTAGHLSKSHKGSSHKLYKAHAVGHTRNPHGRVPSYGKGLYKLPKLGPGDGVEAAGHTLHHVRSASHTLIGSPTVTDLKRNISNTSLPKAGSKVSIKKNFSNISLGRNVSSTKLGNKPKSERAQTKINLRKKGTDDGPIKGTANFEVGDEGKGQDEDWTEDSSSLSPQTTRHNSVGRKNPQLEDPPSPDERPPRSPSNLPQSPPESPPSNASASTNHLEQAEQGDESPSSHPPTADDVTHRLLNRSTHNAAPKTSNISATITPNGSSGSPAFTNSRESTFGGKDSMPSDGISRFLGGAGSKSGSVTPGSISHLQSALAHLNHTSHLQPNRPDSPSPRSSSTVKTPSSRRVKSAATLSHPQLALNDEPGSSISPPKVPPLSSKNPPIKPRNPTPVSLFESARGADPTQGKSMTQLKLDLQRMATQREPPSNQHPFMQHGSVMGVQNLNAGSGEMAKRIERLWRQSWVECEGARRFYPDLYVGGKLGALVRKRGEKKTEGPPKKDEAKMGHQRKDSVKTPVGSGDTAAGRGRVRFEVGTRGDGGDEGEGDDEGVDDLLRRMWEGGEVGGGGE